MDWLLRAARPMLIPFATHWANRQQSLALEKGVALTERESVTAQMLGVENVDRIRLMQVDRIPMPDGPLLGTAARAAGFVSDHTSGLSLGYAIFIRSDVWRDAHIIAHECVHTSQFERLGGMRRYLGEYLREVLTVGYVQAPMEVEAVQKSAAVG
ncbi:MAG: hypothetical protein AAF585_18020 [Verrucomicrobiota bacterium]